MQLPRQPDLEVDLWFQKDDGCRVGHRLPQFRTCFELGVRPILRFCH